MPLRKHQAQFEDFKQELLSGKKIDRLYLEAVPGAGKSTIPVQACELLKHRFADRIMWVVPRLTLGYQAESNFMDPFFKKMLNHNFLIRSATNEFNPCRGTNGFVTTYQAVGVDTKQTVLRELDSHRYIICLDEFHHLEEGGQWHEVFKPIIDRAELLILMTGTMARGSGKKIAYVPYRQTGKNEYRPDFKAKYPNFSHSYIKYSRSDALKEKSILPTKFFLYDGIVEYEELTGARRSGKLSSRDLNPSDAICTALNTKFADNLLQEGLAHWINYKKDHPRSKLMIVGYDIAHAKRISDRVNELGLRCKVASSDDSSAAQVTLKEFKFGDLDILSSVAMAYEGFDSKPLTHVIFLTNIRSIPWIEQVIARPVRIDPESGSYDDQLAFIFAPDDYLLRKVTDSIISDQLQTAKRAELKNSIDELDLLFKSEGGGSKELRINPIDGKLFGSREISLGNIPTGEIAPKTISEEEYELRKQIDIHVKTFCSMYVAEYKKVNSEIKKAFRKSRDLMELSELHKCLQYVKDFYSLSGSPPKRKSRKRGRIIPTYAIPWSG